jgi:hypothetical protein
MPDKPPPPPLALTFTVQRSSGIRLPLRIVKIREKIVSMASAIANAHIDFSKMTCSVFALIADALRDSKPHDPAIDL